MEGISIYEESHKQIKQLMKQNTTGSLNIDYDKLDNNTASELRRAIDNVLIRRCGEVGVMVINTIK